MLQNGYDTELYLGPDIALVLRSAQDFVEEWDEVGEPEFRDTWSGETHVLAPVHNTKFGLSLTCEGPGVWRTPNLRMLRSGMTVTMHSCKLWSEYIPEGETEVMLTRPAVPGSIYAVEPHDLTPHPWSDAVIDGIQHVYTLPAPAGGITINYRPVLVCKVGRVSMTGNNRGRSSGWAVQLREKSAPRI